jgi:hypothetical protein
MYLRGKNRYKQNKDLEKILKDKCSGFVSQDECTDIINYMYNQNDSEILLEKLDKLYAHQEYDELELKKFSREERLR